MESSKAAACHIKQVAGDPQATQITSTQNFQQENTRKRSHLWSLNNQTTSNMAVKGYQGKSQHKKWFDAKSVQINTRVDAQKCGDTAHIEVFQCPAKNINVKLVNKFGHFTSLCFQKKQASSKPRRPKVHQLQAGTVYAKESASCSQSEEDSSSKDSFCLQVKLKCTQGDNQKIPRPIHLITNLAYRLKPHHTRNLYLRAKLNTCVDVNLMPASVCKLVFQDPNMKKLAPSSLEIGTYTTDTIKIVGSCIFYLVPSRYQELNGSNILCCEWMKGVFYYHAKQHWCLA